MHHSLGAAEAAAQVHASCYREHKTTYRLEGAELIEGANSAHVRKVVEEARGMRSGLRGRLIAAMNQYDFDVRLTPSATGFAPKGAGNNGDSVMQPPWTPAGLPLLTIPSGPVSSTTCPQRFSWRAAGIATNGS